MISIEDALHTYEYPSYYKILPEINNWSNDESRIGLGTPVGEGFSYTSDNNKDWMKREELRLWIEKNSDKVGMI